MEKKFIVGICLIVSGIFTGGFFCLGYYITDLIDINTAIQDLRDKVEEEMISDIKETFYDDKGEEWDDINEIFDKVNSFGDKKCFGLSIRFEFLPKEIKNIKPSIFLFFNKIKFKKLNENAKNIKFVNFFDGILVSGLSILFGISIFFLFINKHYDYCFGIVIIIFKVIIFIEIIAMYITKIVFVITQWIYYNGSKIQFSVKFITKCNLNKQFKKYYPFLFNIKKYIICEIFAQLFNLFIILDIYLIKTGIDLEKKKKKSRDDNEDKPNKKSDGLFRYFYK